MEVKTFDLQTAKQIAKHYQFLIGTKIDQSAPWTITDVVVAPFLYEQFVPFLTKYREIGNNDIALAFSGFDNTKVVIKVLYDDKWGGNVFYSDLGKHLDKWNIQKIY